MRHQGTQQDRTRDSNQNPFSNKLLTFEGLFTNLTWIMEDRSLEKLEAGVDRLLDAFEKLKAENRELREKLAGMESKQTLFRDRLDSLIERLDGTLVQ